jgi:hypothetical protein
MIEEDTTLSDTKREYLKKVMGKARDIGIGGISF